jgi:hypothetical protein
MTTTIRSRRQRRRVERLERDVGPRCLYVCGVEDGDSEPFFPLLDVLCLDVSAY